MKISFITSEQLQKDIQQGNDILLLDVREASELTDALGHLSGITHIPLGQLPQRVHEIEQWKNKPVISICRMGGRAQTAAMILLSQGFSNVQVLEGGMTSYRHFEKGQLTSK